MHKEYFNEIFATTKTVIIPGLGSFTKIEGDEHRVNFNPYLKFNDGFLVGFIARKQGISADEAGRQVTENVEKIHAALEQKGEALVLGLGVLKKTADGKIEFVAGMDIETDAPDPEIKPATDAPPKTAVPVPESLNISSSPAEEPELEASVFSPPSGEFFDNTVKENPVIKREEIKITAPVVPAQKEVENVVTPVQQPVTNTDPGVKLENVKVVAPGLTNVNTTNAKNKKARQPGRKRKFPVWLIVVLLLVTGGGIFAGLQWDKVKGWLGIDKHETVAAPADTTKEEAVAVAQAPADTAEVVPADIPDDAPADATEVEQPEPVVEEKVVRAPVTAVNTGNTYHVIVNCFTEPANAGKMVEKLTAEGHAAVNIGQRSGYYMVAAGSFATISEAQSKLEGIKSTYPKAWVYHGL